MSDTEREAAIDWFAARVVELRALVKSADDASAQFQRDSIRLREELERLRQRTSFAVGNVALSHEGGCACMVCENVRLTAELAEAKAVIERLKRERERELREAEARGMERAAETLKEWRHARRPYCQGDTAAEVVGECSMATEFERWLRAEAATRRDAGVEVV